MNNNERAQKIILVVVHIFYMLPAHKIISVSIMLISSLKIFDQCPPKDVFHFVEIFPYPLPLPQPSDAPLCTAPVGGMQAVCRKIDTFYFNNYICTSWLNEHLENTHRRARHFIA